MRKNRAWLFSVMIMAVLVLALLIAFSRTLFLDTAEVRLPEPGTGQEQEPGKTPGGVGDGERYRLVEVSKETVQAVIASLDRPQSFDRDILIETYWGEDGYGETKIRVWSAGGYTRTRTELPGGAVRNVITDAEQGRLWYDGDTEWLTYDAREREDDIVQQIPTYEDVLAIPRAQILEAGYVALSGIDCIYIEVTEDTLGYRERYWISVDTGLLICSETEKEGKIVYRMSSFAVNIPFVGENMFTLPDGTDLLNQK